MGKAGLHVLLYPLLLAALLQSCQGQERKVHIVYLGERPQGDFPAALIHHSMLERGLGSTISAKESLIYSYGKSFNGFAAKFTDEEVAKFSEMEGVISVFPNHKLRLHTTRSWNFMQFKEDKVGIPREGNVIIGLLDSGIWPESDSFSDENLSSPPSKWKGECKGPNFTCNNKIIGARYYNAEQSYGPADIISPRDSEGHGTHTSSTAAGRRVAGASFFGLANGTARGAVPGVRIAVYKVCWSGFCESADILAAFDDAIADGVDIISASLGNVMPVPYFEDPLAIGSFHAMKRGILTSCSAGNAGPHPYSLANYAPWILTVGASTIDRKFVAQVVLGDGRVYTGRSINNFHLDDDTFPLVWGGDAANYSAGADTEISKYCLPGSLNSHKVTGKIVLCEAAPRSLPLIAENGVGTIIASPFFPADAFNFPAPATVVSIEDGLLILDYIRSTKVPFATILFGEALNDVMAPYVASFSSRGPNLITPDILKPDITAPGVDILAAWSPVAPPSFGPHDTRSVKFNIVSGTSMSCPHASGTAAYVKAAYPNWSPAAIKSALMTTAFPMNPDQQEDLEFAYGSGHLDPIGALNPGLVFDTLEADYIDFLCKQGYNTTTVRIITGDNSTVCKSTEFGRAWDLNYPSFSVAVEDGQPIQAVFTRTVTNVGFPNSTYKVHLDMPPTINLTVEPSTLSFSATGEKKSFTVKVSGPIIAQQPIQSGAVFWFDETETYFVRSPVVVYTILPGSANSTFPMPDRKPDFEGFSISTKNGFLRY